MTVATYFVSLLALENWRKTQPMMMMMMIIIIIIICVSSLHDW